MGILKFRGLCRRCAVTLAGLLLGLTIAAGEARSEDQFAPIDIRQIEVGGEIGRRIEMTVKKNLLVIDIDKDFLAPLREKRNPFDYTGLGKLMDSLVRFAAYTKDEQVVALKKHVISEVIKTQEPDGYIGFNREKRIRVWKGCDVHEMGYIVYGLTSDYRFFGEKTSLETARKLADYIITRWSAEPQRNLGHIATLGFERALLTLYEQTNDRRYLDFCVKKHLKLREWDQGIVLGRWGRAKGHAYAFMAHCLAQLQLYRIEPNEKLLAQTRRAMDFIIRQDGMAITGACGYAECWHDTQDGTTHLGETCATAYLIWLLDDLLRLEGDSRYGDIMERAVCNTLFAAQSLDGRRIRYYTPFHGPRRYWERDTYCCPNNFRRIMADLPGMIYYRSGGGLAVNLYTASTAKFEVDGGLSLAVRQETDYPNSGRVVIHLDPSKPATFPLRLRIPRWCAKATIAVNDQPIDKPIPSGAFFTIQRQWKAGDRVELQMPMAWRLVKGRKAQAGRVAVMRGPLLFCLNRTRHKKLADADLRLLTLDPSTLEGPIKDDTVRPDGLACRVGMNSSGPYSYCNKKPDLSLVLTEFADPGGEATYFKVRNPNENGLVDDELIQPDKEKTKRDDSQ